MNTKQSGSAVPASESRPRTRTFSPKITHGFAHGALLACGLLLVLMGTWLLTHTYPGVQGDAELYALQAMSRINPGLSQDVFLQDGTQDKFTIFSPFYASLIKWVGLPGAAAGLLLTFKLLLFAASWTLAYVKSNARVACFAVALLMCTEGIYGGYGVFHYAEDYLTARSLAEALVVSALALRCLDFRIAALMFVVSAIAVHPIMALPGLLALLSFGASTRVNLIAAGSGALLVLAVSFSATRVTPLAGLLTALDPIWLGFVRERSVFLFPHLWTLEDWQNCLRTLVCLGVTALVHGRSSTNKLCLSAGLVGASGTLLALIVGAIGHVALLIQAQVWRWMWVTGFLAVLMSMPTAARMYRDERCGPLAAVLLISGWMVTPLLGTISTTVALFIWCFRDRINPYLGLYVRELAIAVVVLLVAYPTFHSQQLRSGTELFLDRVDFKTLVLLMSLLSIYGIFAIRSSANLALIMAALLIALVTYCPVTLKGILRDLALTNTGAFADWREAIPASSNVYVAPAHYSAAFAWFTLRRPSYLSVNQSAGAVFSRQTTIEIARRSEVLLPILDPDWQLRAELSSWSAADALKRKGRPLTEESLFKVCQDPILGFVIATEILREGRVKHKEVGPFKSWNLYDCALVRTAAPVT